MELNIHVGLKCKKVCHKNKTAAFLIHKRQSALLSSVWFHRNLVEGIDGWKRQPNFHSERGACILMDCIGINLCI